MSEKQTVEVEFTEVKCSVETLNKLLAYLGTRPYNEVGALIDVIRSGFVAMPKAEEAEKAPEKKVVKKKTAPKKVQ
jgi:hypothetical protein